MIEEKESIAIKKLVNQNIVGEKNLKIKVKKEKFKFIDLFAGIGGFHLAMHSVGGKCVFASEWDKFARVTYEENFKAENPELFETGNFNWDIKDADPNLIPDFDILCAGFPCQPFSNAGLKKGFEDTRGTLFFNIADIINTKKEKGNPPKVLLLENVKGLKGHDKGKTLKTIIEVLEDLGYLVNTKVLNSKYFGVPQNRERLFIVAWLKNKKAQTEFNFPVGIDDEGNIILDEQTLLLKSKFVQVGDILLEDVDEKYTISDKLFQGHLRRLKEHKEKGNGFGFSLFDKDSPYTSTISARYYKDGSEILIKQEQANPRKLSPFEAGLLQGYPMKDRFKLVVSDVQAYKQFGNSVSVPVVKTLAKEILSQLLSI
jgi:DNA (cytosine-5)-methyltransferase 1